MDQLYTTLPAFFALVRDRPDPGLSVLTAGCPACDSDDPPRLVTHTRTPLPCDDLDELTPADPNHHWFRLRCPACARELLLEQCRGNAWLVRHEHGYRVLVAGVPSCHEDYVYTCRRCGGPVHRRRRISGPASFACWRCSAAVESAEAYYRPSDALGGGAARAEVRCGPCRELVEVAIGSVAWHDQPAPRPSRRGRWRPRCDAGQVGRASRRRPATDLGVAIAGGQGPTNLVPTMHAN
jgi:hypothetical protein